MDKIKELVEFIAKALVYHPEEIKVSCREDEDAYVVEVTASEEDYGRIIGKKGKIIHAIRTLISMAATDHKKRWVLDVPATKDQASKD